MREDYIEKLDHMFPDGYVIAYTCPNGTIRLTLYNPHKHEYVDKLHKALKEMAAEEKP